jgi:hypothetical protein
LSAVSAGLLSAGLDMLSMLIVQPCADPEIRLQFLDAVLQGFHRYSRHVCPEHWALIELLAADLGALERVSASLPSPESVASPADDPLVELSRASVALYSLTESALRQVKRILEDRYPGVKVSLNSNFVGTARLKQLARQADLFVVATASAKHAATEFIDANRPRGRCVGGSVGR